MSAPSSMSGPPEGGWESLKVDELKAELEARGLPKSGAKAELVARLEDDELAQAANAPKEEARAEEVVDAAAAGEAVAEEDAEEEPEDAPDTVAEEVVAPDEPAEEPTADEVTGDGEGGEPSKPARRRGSAETTASRRRRRAPGPEGQVVVRARARYVRSAPRKARLVMDHIRGKRVEQAQAILVHAPRAVSTDILKLLNSAVANAESAYELGPDELRVRRAFVDEGPTIKRFRPRALGRATKINKRTSHMTIELTTEGNGR